MQSVAVHRSTDPDLVGGAFVALQWLPGRAIPGRHTKGFALRSCAYLNSAFWTISALLLGNGQILAMGSGSGYDYRGNTGVA
jgi:hypothetical protein